MGTMAHPLPSLRCASCAALCLVLVTYHAKGQRFGKAEGMCGSGGMCRTATGFCSQTIRINKNIDKSAQRGMSCRAHSLPSHPVPSSCVVNPSHFLRHFSLLVCATWCGDW
jgi:hypothetical protein